MIMIRKTATLLLALLCLLASPSPGWAAYMELSAAAAKALDATANRAGRATADRIGALYGDFLASQKEERGWDARIKTLHSANAGAESALRRDIWNIDASKLQRIGLQLKQTKERYQPLFERYTTLNKQIAAARALKSKELNSLLGLQAEMMKSAVQSARQDVRTKEEALRAAKAEANRKMKELRGSLAGVDLLEANIKTLKQETAKANKHITPAWKSLNEYAKKGDASGAVASLSTLLTLIRQIGGHKQEIHRLEGRIDDLIRNVKHRLVAAQS